MPKGGKNYFVTFIDYYSRYTKVYLIKHKDEAFSNIPIENYFNKINNI